MAAHDVYDFWAERIEPAERAAITRFWEVLAPRATAMRDAAESNDGRQIMEVIVGTVQEAMGDLDDVIMWEMGPNKDDDGLYALAFTAELNHEARPLARALVAAAPPIEGFRILEARPGVSSHTAFETVMGLTQGRLQQPLNITGAEAREGEHHTLDIVGTGRGASRQLGGEAGVLFSVLVGEAVERDWLGDIDGVFEGGGSGGLISRLFGGGGGEGQPQARNPMVWIPEFETQATSLLASLRDRVPAEPFHEIGGEVQTKTLDPADNDWEEDPRRDTARFETAAGAYFTARHAGARIAACRFSRQPLAFLGLRLQRVPGSAWESPAEQKALADALDQALRAAGLGGVWGHGEGEGHVYVDFTASDIAAAAEALNRFLAAQPITNPAAMLFDEAGVETRMLPLTPAAVH